MPKPLTDAEVEEARRVIAVQAATAPPDGDLSPAGSWARAAYVVGVGGRKAHDYIDGPTGFPGQDNDPRIPRRRT
jgi:hypothetical protein